MVDAVLLEKRGVGEVAKAHGISRYWLYQLPHHEQITQQFCIQGWSGIAKWGGV